MTRSCSRVAALCGLVLSIGACGDDVGSMVGPSSQANGANAGMAPAGVGGGMMASAGTGAPAAGTSAPMAGMDGQTTPAAGTGAMAGAGPAAGTGAGAEAGTGAGAEAGTGAGAEAGTGAGAEAGMGAGMAGMAGMVGTAGNPAGTPEEVNVAVEGPHSYDTFTEGARAPEYAEGLVYYPTDAEGPFPVMILSPGLTASNTDYEVWGRVLASHGIVALLMQPTSTSDWNTARATDLRAALGVVRGALNESGPVAGKLDTANVGFMGQSMGGGGTLIAANEIGDEIQAAIPMQPYAPGSRFPNITAPTLIIGAERDTVAGVSSNAYAHYNSIPDSTVKIYMEGAGADHYYSTDRNENDFDMNARFAIAFLKVYLEGDARYETYLYGAEREAVASETSRYLTSQQ